MTSKKNDVQTVVRLPTDVLHKIDQLAERMSLAASGVKITRAAVIRMILSKGVACPVDDYIDFRVPTKAKKIVYLGEVVERKTLNK